MKSRTAALPSVYLKPGEFAISGEPSVITTVLGSCISVTMFNPRLKIGAICHGLLPQCKDEGPCDNACGNGFKYVDCSIRLMLEEFRKKGVGAAEIETKLFGGSDMYLPEEIRPGNITVGRQNIDAAFRICGEERLQVLKSDTGGIYSRKILFHPHTGEVYLKRTKVQGRRKGQGVITGNSGTGE
ncbi:MAG: chemotaxis protein CheD [Thermodesulfovibrio sp.]|nr:chemotaxis protein CheD [Thermodesulfovibrio sp.]